MGLVTSIVMAVAAVAGAAIAYEGRQDQKEANRNAASDRRKAQAEVNAANAQKQAMERRSAVREERVRRSRIMQAAENTGTAGSSGEIGALGSLGTQLGSNLGINAGFAQTGRNITAYEQSAADFNTAAQNAAIKAQDGQSLFNIGISGLGKG